MSGRTNNLLTQCLWMFAWQTGVRLLQAPAAPSPPADGKEDPGSHQHFADGGKRIARFNVVLPEGL